MSFGDEKEAKIFLKELRFYNALTKKPYIKRLNNVAILRELPFYDELNIVEISKIFKGYVRTYSIEIIDSKDPSVQLKTSKPIIEVLFKDLFAEIKGFKYKVTLKVSLSVQIKYRQRTFSCLFQFYC